MSSPFKRLKEVYARTYSLDTGRDADFFDCVNDIYFSPEVQSLKKYPQRFPVCKNQRKYCGYFIFGAKSLTFNRLSGVM